MDLQVKEKVEEVQQDFKTAFQRLKEAPGKLRSRIRESDYRLKLTMVIAVVSTVLVSILYPQQLGVLLFKANVLTISALAAYHLDRALFPFARPHAEDPRDSWMYRRVALIVGVMLAMALIL